LELQIVRGGLPVSFEKKEIRPEVKLNMKLINLHFDEAVPQTKEANWKEKRFGGNDFLSKAHREYVERLFEKFGHSRGEEYIRRLAHPAAIFCTALAGEYAQL
jgi:hypothetical protein